MILQIGLCLLVLSLLTFLYFDNQQLPITQDQKTICKALIAISIAVTGVGIALLVNS